MRRGKSEKLDTFLSLSRQRAIQILIGVGFLYLFMVSVEIPIVFKTGFSVVSQDPLIRTNHRLNSEVNMDQTEAPTRPVERVSIRNSFQPSSSRVPTKHRILSSLVFDRKAFEAGSKDRASELYESAKVAWEVGKQYWEELESGKVAIVSDKAVNRSESCPPSVSLSRSEFSATKQVMVIPCGLTLGSHITLVGKPRAAHEEEEPKISLLKDGFDSVMVSQFKMELQGLNAVEGEDPPRVLHFNPRLRGDWSGKPVIEQNTCYRMQWGTAHRCEGWKSKADEETVDGQVKCEKWIRNDDNHLEENKATWWLSRLIGRTKKVSVDWPFPFAEDKLFVLTLSAGLEGYHINVDGRHVTSFPYRPGFTLEDATGLSLSLTDMSDKGEHDKAIEPVMRQNEVESESDDNSDDIYSDEGDCHEFNAMKAISNVAKFVCTTEVDPRIVSSDSFTGFMKLLNPHFELDYTAVQTECVAIFLKEKSKIMEMLGNFDGEISVSVREMGMTKSFVLVSLHFIDENWSLKNWVIKFCSLVKPSFVSPCDVIVESLKDWSIKNKVSTVTMSSFFDDDAFDFIKEHGLEDKKLSLNGDLFRVYCCSDCISLMVQNAFEEVEGITDKIRCLYNPKSEPLWYLTSSKLKDAIELWSMGEFSSENVTDYSDVPTVEEWNRVEQVCNIVESIYKVAYGIFHKELVTANHFLYLLNEIRALLIPISIKPESFERDIAKGMLEHLDKYLKDMFLVLAIAAVLDPRFKMKYVEFTCSQVWGSSVSNGTDDGISKAKTFSDAIRDLFDDYVSRYSKTVSSSSSSLMQGYKQFIQSQKCDTKSELELYLEQPIMPWSDDFSVLNWWKTLSIQYPILSKMARDILAIPMSLTTSYEAFYTEPRPVQKYLRVNSKMANALVCTRSWFKKDSTTTSP